jgi:hypothetical protein
MGDPEIKCNPLLSKEMVMESIAIRCRCRRRWMVSAADADEEYKLVFIKNNYFLGKVYLVDR